MQQSLAHVLSVAVYRPLPSLFLLRLAAPALVAGMQPGQFLLANVETEYVRRPLFPVAFDEQGCSLLLPRHGPWRSLGPGDGLDCIGPLGKGFPMPAAVQNLLLFAQPYQDRNGVVFLLSLIDQALQAGKRVVLVHEAPTAAQLFPPAALPSTVEVHLVTGDGSRGRPGAALDLLPELAQWADQVYAAGEPVWYRALVRGLETHRLSVGPGLAWGFIAPELMPCGMGVCGGCAVETARGYRYPCSDGPVFDLTQI